jgi:hypothetical protein
MLPELEKLQHLQTAPVDENPVVEEGRNFSAGYLRETGLQYGNVVPFTERSDQKTWESAPRRGRVEKSQPPTLGGPHHATIRDTAGTSCAGSAGVVEQAP